MNLEQHIHGGDLTAAVEQYQIPIEEIADFSGNINPLGFPPQVAALLSAHINIVSRYPDKNYSALKKSIAAYTNASPSHICVGNGSTEFITSLIKTCQPKQTLIIGPAYSEYEYAVTLWGSAVTYFELEEKDDFVLSVPKLLQTLDQGVDFLILCNPNNPTGTATNTEDLEVIIKFCESRQIFVMIDETYMEFCNPAELYCAIPLCKRYANLFVIRGVSKFFAAPGLRLGYGITSNEKVLNTLKQQQDPWAVNILASFAGEHLFSQTDFIHQTKELIHSEREKMMHQLSGWKTIKPYPTQSNFMLIRIAKEIPSQTIAQKMMEQKMLIRDASSFYFLDEHFIRFCFLLPAQNAKLLSALHCLLES